MQKIGMVLAMLVCAIIAQAGEYAYLVFTNTQGTKTALSVTDLTMKVNGTQLDVTNADGTLNLVLTDLAMARACRKVSTMSSMLTHRSTSTRSLVSNSDTTIACSKQQECSARAVM